jgi:protoheme IX farnesyltransferase
MHISGIVYLAGAIILHSLFILSAVRVWRDTTFKFAKIMFGYSIFYLFGLFALMMIGKV